MSSLSSNLLFFIFAEKLVCLTALITVTLKAVSVQILLYLSKHDVPTDNSAVEKVTYWESFLRQAILKSQLFKKPHDSR